MDTMFDNIDQSEPSVIGVVDGSAPSAMPITTSMHAYQEPPPVPEVEDIPFTWRNSRARRPH